MKSFGPLTVFFLISTFIVTRSDGCSCGGGCGSYASPSQCGRCCTQLVKRSSNPSLYHEESENMIPTDFIDKLQPDNNFRLKNPSQQSLNKPHFVFIQKRDTCGCNMGCFYSAPMECARCCSHGVRDVNPYLYPKIDHDDEKEILEETNEGVSELQQLLNYIATFGDNRRNDRNN